MISNVVFVRIDCGGLSNARDADHNSAAIAHIVGHAPAAELSFAMAVRVPAMSCSYVSRVALRTHAQKKRQ